MLTHEYFYVVVTVVFYHLHLSEFVAVARQLFHMQLDDSNVGSTSVSHGGYDVTDFAEPPPFQPQVVKCSFFSS